MNNKGFTLIELLAALAIMAILSIMITPGILAIRSEIMEDTYNNKINLINRGALEWANENNNINKLKYSVQSNYDGTKAWTNDCYIIEVDELIDKGYVVGDSNNKTILTNPLGEKEFNDFWVCIRYDTNDVLTRKIITYVIED